MKFYVVWRRPNGSYYYRYVYGYYKNYSIGYMNQYGHEVILIIYPEYQHDSYIKRKLKFYLYWLYKKL